MTTLFSLGAIIGPNELLTSSALIARCVDRGFKAAHARQLVRRGAMRNGIWRSEKLSLPGNGRLFAHQQFRGNAGFMAQLLPMLSEYRPGLFRVAKKLEQDDVLIKPHARLLLATPNDPQKTSYPSYEEELGTLEELNICRVEARGAGAERLASHRVAGTPMSSAAALAARTRLQIEEALAGILTDHFRFQNFVSWNPFPAQEPREQLFPFNNYLFTAVTFTWLSPLIRWEDTKRKPMPVIFHVTSGKCTRWDVDAFLTRIERAGANKTSKLRALGVVAARYFEREAWKKAQEAGLMTINLHQLFGEEAFEVIVKVQELLKNVAGDPDRARPEEYQALSKTLESLATNPFITDLKSLAFECVSAFLIKHEGWEEVSLNLKVPFSLPEGATEREVDVSGQKSGWDEVCVIECKAEHQNKPLDEQFVRKFFTQTVPAFLKAKCPIRNPSHCRAEIWTTGVVSEAAKNVLDGLKLKKFIQPALVGRDQLIANLPKTLQPISRLIQTISQTGANIEGLDSSQTTIQPISDSGNLIQG